MSEAITEAVQESLTDGVVVSWVIVAEVSRADDTRYLAHRAGGLSGAPWAWGALGMLQSAVRVAERQVLDCTDSPEDEDEDEDEDDSSE